MATWMFPGKRNRVHLGPRPRIEFPQVLQPEDGGYQGHRHSKSWKWEERSIPRSLFPDPSCAHLCPLLQEGTCLNYGFDWPPTLGKRLSVAFYKLHVGFINLHAFYKSHQFIKSINYAAPQLLVQSQRRTRSPEVGRWTQEHHPARSSTSCHRCKAVSLRYVTFSPLAIFYTPRA